jgi:hypothetical protein
MGKWIVRWDFEANQVSKPLSGSKRLAELKARHSSSGDTEHTSLRARQWAQSAPELLRMPTLRLDRVIGAELSEETFGPAEVMTPGKRPEWNVPREW